MELHDVDFLYFAGIDFWELLVFDNWKYRSTAYIIHNFSIQSISNFQNIAVQFCSITAGTVPNTQEVGKKRREESGKTKEASGVGV